MRMRNKKVKARLDNFNNKDIKTIDEIVIQYDEEPLALELNEEEFNNSLNIHFDSLEELEAILNWLNKALKFWRQEN